MEQEQNEVVDIRITNAKQEIVALLGEDFKNCRLSPIPFKEGATVADFNKQSHQGVYLLLVKAETVEQPAVHIVVQVNGQLKNATTALLRKPLVAVEFVLRENEPVN
jgi:hypothetical protein